MLITSLTTMPFSSFLLLVLLHFSPNCLTISSSYHRGSLHWVFPASFSRIPLDNCTGTPDVCELCNVSGPVNFCFRYSVITSFTLLCS